MKKILERHEEQEVNKDHESVQNTTSMTTCSPALGREEFSLQITDYKS
jgi:hypothetical protein